MVTRIGHRGAAGHEPENTLLSLRKAVELDCDITEIDVHVCSSGEVVVIHDETVDRTTDGTGFVSEITLDQLKALDAGKQETVPTLEEVLKELKGEIKLNIELKGQGTPIPVLNLVEGSGWDNENLILTSFDWNMLEEYRSLDPDALLGPLAHVNIFHASRFASKINAYCVNPLYKLCSRSFVNKAHRGGFKVYPWTVNDEEDIKRVKEHGVDGVISDYPELI